MIKCVPKSYRFGKYSNRTLNVGAYEFLGTFHHSIHFNNNFSGPRCQIQKKKNNQKTNQDYRLIPIPIYLISSVN